MRVRELRIAALTDSPDAFGALIDEVAHRSESLWRQQINDMPTFVATHNGVDSGLVRVAPDTSEARCCWLISMWVRPISRGSGIGDLLVQAALACAASQGYETMYLDVGVDNRSAICLYRRNGFEANGVRGALPAPRQHILELQMTRWLTD